jgi:hypothetical protein
MYRLVSWRLRTQKGIRAVADRFGDELRGLGRGSE